MPKCVSKCRKIPKDLCVNECQYVNGPRNKYCRLSQKYQMDEDCLVHLKQKKTKKCVSKCRKIPEELCKDECQYVKTARYKYCRLSQKYQMDKDCNVLKRSLKRHFKISFQNVSNVTQNISFKNVRYRMHVTG